MYVYPLPICKKKIKKIAQSFFSLGWVKEQYIIYIHMLRGGMVGVKID